MTRAQLSPPRRQLHPWRRALPDENSVTLRRPKIRTPCLKPPPSKRSRPRVQSSTIPGARDGEEFGRDHHGCSDQMNPRIVLAAYHPDYPRNRMTEASDASRKLKRASLHKIQLPALRFPHHRIAFRFKLAAGFPFRKFRAVGYFVADHEEKLRVLHCAG